MLVNCRLGRCTPHGHNVGKLSVSLVVIGPKLTFGGFLFASSNNLPEVGQLSVCCFGWLCAVKGTMFTIVDLIYYLARQDSIAIIGLIVDFHRRFVYSHQVAMTEYCHSIG